MPRQSRKRKHARGFTLLEIMVTITIIGLVAGVVAVGVMDALKQARVDVTKQSIVECESALKLYALRHGRYPDTAQGLKSLVAERFVGGGKMPLDGWGAEFAYVGERDHYTITSYGEDGVPGGDAYAADISVEGGR